MNRAELVEKKHPKLSVRRQCELLHVTRSVFYYKPMEPSDSERRIMRALDVEDRLLDIVPDARLSPLDPRSDTGRARQRVRKSSASKPDEDWSWDDEAP